MGLNYKPNFSTGTRAGAVPTGTNPTSEPEQFQPEPTLHRSQSSSNRNQPYTGARAVPTGTNPTPEPEQFQPEPTLHRSRSSSNRNQPYTGAGLVPTLPRQQDACLDTANVSNILCNVPKCLQKSSKAKCCNLIKIF